MFNNNKAMQDIMELIALLFVTSLILVTVILVSLYSGREALNMYLQKHLFYLILTGIFIPILAALRVGRILVRSRPELYKRWGWVYATIFSPEEGLVSKLNLYGIRWMQSFWLSNYIYVIFFAAVGLVSLNTQIFFVKAPPITAMQISEISNGILNVALPPFAENIFIYCPMFIIMGLILWKKLTPLLVVVPPIIGILGVMLHIAAMGYAETLIAFTFMFWMLTAAMVIITGNIFIAIIFHFFNNLFYYLKFPCGTGVEAATCAFSYNPEIVTVVAVAAIMLLGAILALIMFIRHSKGEKVYTEY